MKCSNIKVIISLFILVGILHTNCTNTPETEGIEVGQFFIGIPLNYTSCKIDSIPEELGGLNGFYTSISECFAYNNIYLLVHHISDSCGSKPDDLIDKANELDRIYYEVYPSGKWEIDSIVEKEFGHMLVGQGKIEFTIGEYNLRYSILSLEGRSLYIQLVGKNSSNLEIENDMNSIIQMMKMKKE